MSKQDKEEALAPVRFSSATRTLDITVVADTDKFEGGVYRGKTPDKIAQFRNGLLVTADSQIIEALRKHRDFGRTIIEIPSKAA
jgi:hypothetical protein